MNDGVILENMRQMLLLMLMASLIALSLHCEPAYTATPPIVYNPTESTIRTAERPKPSQARFRVFDSMLFTDKPNLTRAGLENILTTDREFFAGTYPNYDTTKGDEVNSRKLARKLALTGTPLVIDIEHWSIDIRAEQEETVETNIRKLIQIIDWIRHERPEVKLGFYGLLPLQDYWTPVRHLTAIERGMLNAKFEADYKAWQAANDRLKRLAEKVDFVFPSLYTFYDDIEGWKKYARCNIEEARKFGRPVYPFLWMDYHDSNKELKGQQLPAETWQAELALCRELADGVVIWGGWKRQWNPWAPWWKVTVEFIQRENAVK
jgi:hypothetical protein